MSIQVVSHEVVDSDEFLEKPRTLEVCVIRGWLKRPPSGRRTAGKVNVGCASSALNGGKAEDDSQTTADVGRTPRGHGGAHDCSLVGRGLDGRGAPGGCRGCARSTRRRDLVSDIGRSSGSRWW